MIENVLLEDASILTSYEEDDCLLCEYTRGSHYFKEVLNLDINISKNRIFESEHFVLMHDIHPILPGHCLLMTKNHLLAFAQVPLAYHLELTQIMQMAIVFITKKYCPPIIFEHGSMRGEPGSGVCINHAHLHLIPSSVDISNEIQYYSVSALQNQQVNILHDLRDVNDHYLFYQNASGSGCVVREPKLPLPQQFIRRVIAKKHQSDAWDWKHALYLNG